MTKSKGLGDTVAKVAKKTKVDKVVKFLKGEDCGCEERQAKLNKLFPYKRSECLTEKEYKFLAKYPAEPSKPSLQNELVRIYNRVFNSDYVVSGCPDCLRTVESELSKVVKLYEDK